MENLLGVVLCGGESRRMGTDKGLIQIGDEHWTSLVAGKLEALSLPVLISINPSQQEQYSKLFPEKQLIVDDIDIEGPLKGVLSVHKNFPEKDILLLACDLLDISTDTIENVLSAFQKEPGSDFYCYHHDSFFEPFCGIYTAPGLKKIDAQLESGDLHNYSFQYVLNSYSTKKIIPLDMSEFKNRNSEVR